MIHTHRTPPTQVKEMVMPDQPNSEQSKTVVDAYYQAGVEGRLMDFAQYLLPDFTTTAPNYLPWGVVHPAPPLLGGTAKEKALVTILEASG